MTHPVRILIPSPAELVEPSAMSAGSMVDVAEWTGAWKGDGEFVARRDFESCPDCDRVGTGRPVPGESGRVECAGCGASWDRDNTDATSASGGGR